MIKNYKRQSSSHKCEVIVESARKSGVIEFIVNKM